MSRKNKRAHQRKPQRGPGGPVSRTPGAVPGAVPRPLASSDAAALSPTPRPMRGRGPAPISLLEQDAAIPLDRVPYFRSDLRRIAITAAAMFAVLIIGSFFIR